MLGHDPVSDTRQIWRSALSRSLPDLRLIVPRLGGRCSQRGSPPPESLTGEAVAGAGDRRTELHHRMTALNADSIDAVVAPERHLGSASGRSIAQSSFSVHSWSVHKVCPSLVVGLFLGPMATCSSDNQTRTTLTTAVVTMATVAPITLVRTARTSTSARGPSSTVWRPSQHPGVGGDASMDV
jgi:hypothetical protein